MEVRYISDSDSVYYNANDVFFGKGRGFRLVVDTYGSQVAAKLITGKGDLYKILQALKKSEYKVKDYATGKNVRLIDSVRYGINGKTFAQLEPVIEAAEHNKQILKARRSL